MTARRFAVRGRVQGVGFRFFVSERAAFEGLAGWVRNTDDGGVEAEVEGDREAVDRFERLVRQGPAGARVDGVDVTDVTPEGRRGFSITR
ncbi:MAG: acylphosphatase [Acidobacteriota bacterium]|nr:acylphosphatase [Acidobacteriota bacterium]